MMAIGPSRPLVDDPFDWRWSSIHAYTRRAYLRQPGGALMATCFVIQPIDSGKFDKRFQDIYKPAIEAAGLEAYRVDHDPGVLVPIESIEKGIRLASICLADITADNPNVWYELGYAFAAERPVVMVCSEERIGKKYPFDIQHRSIISYAADSASDFSGCAKV
ncbi:MAG: hypothetical protein U1E42_13835 [Rhodospirillales bacterium]